MLFFNLLSSKFHHSNSKSFPITSGEKRYLITLAGTPPTIAYGGTSLTTTAPAATQAPLPICTPPFIRTCEPIHTSLPIITRSSNDLCSKKSFSIQHCCSAFLFSVKIGDVEMYCKGCPLIPILQLSAIEQNLPISAFSISVLAAT